MLYPPCWLLKCFYIFKCQLTGDRNAGPYEETYVYITGQAFGWSQPPNHPQHKYHGVWAPWDLWSLQVCCQDPLCWESPWSTAKMRGDSGTFMCSQTPALASDANSLCPPNGGVNLKHWADIPGWNERAYACPVMPKQQVTLAQTGERRKVACWLLVTCPQNFTGWN